MKRGFCLLLLLPTACLPQTFTIRGARIFDCGYRKFKISRNSGAPAAIVTEIVTEMITLGLGNVPEQALSWRAGALLGERMRNGPASTCVASGGASFVTMVKSADLRGSRSLGPTPADALSVVPASPSPATGEDGSRDSKKNTPSGFGADWSHLQAIT